MLPDLIMSNNKKNNQFVHCPNCNASVAWSDDSKYKPFCSERCKMIDLGEWLDEKNTIAGDPYHEDSDEF